MTEPEPPVLRPTGALEVSSELQAFCDRMNAKPFVRNSGWWYRVIVVERGGVKRQETDKLEGHQADAARRAHEELVAQRKAAAGGKPR